MLRTYTIAENFSHEVLGMPRRRSTHLPRTEHIEEFAEAWDNEDILSNKWGVRCGVEAFPGIFVVPEMWRSEGPAEMGK